jgi:hypothetical protein
MGVNRLVLSASRRDVVVAMSRQRLRLALVASALPGSDRQRVEISPVMSVPRRVEKQSSSIPVHKMPIPLVSDKCMQRLRLAILASALRELVVVSPWTYDEVGSIRIIRVAKSLSAKMAGILSNETLTVANLAVSKKPLRLTKNMSPAENGSGGSHALLVRRTRRGFPSFTVGWPGQAGSRATPCPPSSACHLPQSKRAVLRTRIIKSRGHGPR